VARAKPASRRSGRNPASGSVRLLTPPPGP
jgi:hypothetical protein